MARPGDYGETVKRAARSVTESARSVSEDPAIAAATANAKARRIMDPSRFPQMLYKRPPTGNDASRVVKDPVELQEALAEGWREEP